MDTEIKIYALPKEILESWTKNVQEEALAEKEGRPPKYPSPFPVDPELLELGNNFWFKWKRLERIHPHSEQYTLIFNDIIQIKDKIKKRVNLLVSRKLEKNRKQFEKLLEG